LVSNFPCPSFLIPFFISPCFSPIHLPSLFSSPSPLFQLLLPCYFYFITCFSPFVVVYVLN
jgi:hypothetical protein